MRELRYKRPEIQMKSEHTLFEIQIPGELKNFYSLEFSYLFHTDKKQLEDFYSEIEHFYLTSSKAISIPLLIFPVLFLIIVYPVLEDYNNFWILHPIFSFAALGLGLLAMYLLGKHNYTTSLLYPIKRMKYKREITKYFQLDASGAYRLRGISVY